MQRSFFSSWHLQPIALLSHTPECVHRVLFSRQHLVHCPVILNLNRLCARCLEPACCSVVISFVQVPTNPGIMNSS